MGKTHAEAWSELGLENEIKYVVTRGTRAWTSPAPHARFVAEIDIALRDAEVDVVSICVPTALHAEFAIRASRAGKHVLIEKPIALTIADAQQMATESRANGVTLMTAHVVRFFAGYALARVIAQNGSLGEILSVRASRAMATPSWSSWIQDERQSGGILVDLAIHDFDQTNLLLGAAEHVSSVRGSAPNEIRSTIAYEGGGIAEVFTNPGLPDGSSFSSSLEIVGSAGSLEYGFRAHEPSASGREGSDILASVLKISTAHTRRVLTVPENKPYRDEVAYFVRCVETKTEPILCAAESSVSALEVALAANRSLQQGGPEYL